MGQTRKGMLKTPWCGSMVRLRELAPWPYYVKTCQVVIAWPGSSATSVAPFPAFTSSVEYSCRLGLLYSMLFDIMCFLSRLRLYAETGWCLLLRCSPELWILRKGNGDRTGLKPCTKQCWI